VCVCVRVAGDVADPIREEWLAHLFGSSTAELALSLSFLQLCESRFRAARDLCLLVEIAERQQSALGLDAAELGQVRFRLMALCKVLFLLRWFVIFLLNYISFSIKREREREK
jgi:hypothetical protein